MKRFLPYIIVAIAALWVASAWRDPSPKPNDFDTRNFSRIPVLVGGRIKPLDTVARNALLIMRGKQTLRYDGKSIPATRWLLDVLFPEDDKEEEGRFRIAALAVVLDDSTFELLLLLFLERAALFDESGRPVHRPKQRHTKKRGQQEQSNMIRHC